MKQVFIDRGIFDADEFLQSIVDRAPENWANMTKHGKKQLLGCFDLLSSDGREILVFPIWETYEEKKAAVNFVKAVARERNCVALGIFQEAWQVDATKRIPGLMPSEHPEHLRQEILFVLLMSNTGTPPRCIQWQIIREGTRDGKRARLGDPVAMPRFSTDTFADMLPPREIAKH